MILAGSSAAMVLLSPPRPDVRLSLAVPYNDFADLRALLLGFSKDEQMIVYSDVPRAWGKQFFLGLQRDDSILIIVEKSPSEAAINIDCDNINNSAQDFPAVERRLGSRFKAKWTVSEVNR